MGESPDSAVQQDLNRANSIGIARAAQNVSPASRGQLRGLKSKTDGNYRNIPQQP